MGVSTNYFACVAVLAAMTIVTGTVYAQSEYEDVFWPDDCLAYEDLDTCLDYYCASYWDIDGFSSYSGCLEDPFVYIDLYGDVIWPEDCYSRENTDLCLVYYCSFYWIIDGFSSHSSCLMNPFAYSSFEESLVPEDSGGSEQTLHTRSGIPAGHATIDLQLLDDMWNSGEMIPVVIVDMNANRNGMYDEDLLVSNPNIRSIPTLVTGDPVVITEDTEINGIPIWYMSNGWYDPVAARIVVDGSIIDGDILTITFEAVIDLPTDDTVFNYINYDVSSLGVYVESVSACGNIIDGNPYTIAYMAIDERAVNGCDTITFSLEDGVHQGMYSIVVDFMSFGYTDDGVQDYERIADQIIRIEVEETDDDTGVFEGALEYIMVNQLNVAYQSTFDSVFPNTDVPVFIVMGNLVGDDAPKISYLDVGSDDVVMQIFDQEAAPTHSGTVTFDSNTYRIGDVVTITLDDVDLNVDSGIVEVYTIDDETGFIGDHGTVILDVMFDYKPWSTTFANPDCLEILLTMTGDTGLGAAQFALVETGRDSGVFIGNFRVPSDWCRPGAEYPEATSGLGMGVNYLDFRDASGDIIEVGDDASIRANTGSVSLDRTVYPVPFGEPRDFSVLSTLLLEMEDAEYARDRLQLHEALLDVIDEAIDNLHMPADLVPDGDFPLKGDLARLFVDLHQGSNDWDQILDNLDDSLDEVKDLVSSMRNIDNIIVDLADAEDELVDMEVRGVNPDGRSYFPIHSTGFGFDKSNANAFISDGDLTIHVRVSDADYDVSAAGQDAISGSGDGPVTVYVNRGSHTCILATAGGVEELVEDEFGCNGEYMRYGPIQEIAPDASVFEMDITVRYNHGPPDEKCPIRGEGCILQGDILQVEYEDPADASGVRNVATASAMFEMGDAILESDTDSYRIGTDMILTLIEPDFDLDNDQVETYTLDIVEWDSDAATLTMGSRGGQISAFDPSPDAFRETGADTGVFQVLINIPEELEGNRLLEMGESITLEYIDWSPDGADYVGDESESITLHIETDDQSPANADQVKEQSGTSGVDMTTDNDESNTVLAYADTSDPVYAGVRSWLIENESLFIGSTIESMSELLSIGFEECGQANAFYQSYSKSIVMCYELVVAFAEVFRGADSWDTTGGTANALQWVLLHEIGHAVIDIGDLPITGKEEDAADQFATLISLLESDGESSPAIAMAYVYNSTGSDSSPPWGVHSFDSQRYYNLLCLVYGYDPDGTYGLAVESLIPESRRVLCPSETEQALNAWAALFALPE